jgi:hypothetical protein
MVPWVLYHAEVIRQTWRPTDPARRSGHLFDILDAWRHGGAGAALERHDAWPWRRRRPADLLRYRDTIRVTRGTIGWRVATETTLEARVLRASFYLLLREVPL